MEIQTSDMLTYYIGDSVSSKDVAREAGNNVGEAYLFHPLGKISAVVTKASSEISGTFKPSCSATQGTCLFEKTVAGFKRFKERLFQEGQNFCRKYDLSLLITAYEDERYYRAVILDVNRATEMQGLSVWEQEFAIGTSEWRMAVCMLVSQLSGSVSFMETGCSFCS